ncbi:hypothetical protein ACSTS3_01965 [Aquimarina muelleri]|uniref:hypothetical protein n=1 Tax=Aquimarina muelleri TaxID=279356 RepID=UPI003F684780
MKTFKNIICFILLSVLFKISISAKNTSFSEISIDNSIEKNHSVQSLLNLEMYLYIDTETEPLVRVSQPDNLPLSPDNKTSKKDGLLNRSHQLSLAYSHHFQNYDRDFFNKSFKKQIIFPFHSFW